LKGEFEKRIKKWKAKGLPENIRPMTDLVMMLRTVEEAKKEFPFASWLKEDLEELKMTIKRSIKECGHSVLDDEVSEEFIKTLDAIVKWFGTK